MRRRGAAENTGSVCTEPLLVRRDEDSPTALQNGSNLRFAVSCFLRGS